MRSANVSRLGRTVSNVTAVSIYWAYNANRALQSPGSTSRIFKRNPTPFYRIILSHRPVSGNAAIFLAGRTSPFPKNEGQSLVSLHPALYNQNRTQKEEECKLKHKKAIQFIAACFLLLSLFGCRAAEPAAPDYADSSNWAYWQIGQEKNADLFLLCPTVFSGNTGQYNFPLSDT